MAIAIKAAIAFMFPVNLAFAVIVARTISAMLIQDTDIGQETAAGHDRFMLASPPLQQQSEALVSTAPWRFLVKILSFSSGRAGTGPGRSS